MLVNPILNKPKNILFYLLFWFIITIVYFSLLFFGLKIESQTAIVDSIIFNLLLAGLGLSFWYPSRFINFENNKTSIIILSHLIGSIISTVIWLVVGYYLVTNIIGSKNYSNFFFETLPWRCLIGILFYALITSFYYTIIYYTGFQDRVLKESELKSLITQAELKSLKFQINPHFIFNSLNSISALTTIDPDKSREMILKLADFLRYTLAKNEQQMNKLGEELRNIKLYLEIEKIRFEDKFEFREEVDPQYYDVQVPNMILQPLFENAIKHSVYETLEKVTLKLKCRGESNFLKIDLENNTDNADKNNKGTGTGLKNIRSRLELIYGQNDLMEVKKDKNIFKVSLFIPLQ
jgi:two-component system, LytTR family, sensor kinase